MSDPRRHSGSSREDLLREKAQEAEERALWAMQYGEDAWERAGVYEELRDDVEAGDRWAFVAALEMALSTHDVPRWLRDRFLEAARRHERRETAHFGQHVFPRSARGADVYWDALIEWRGIRGSRRAFLNRLMDAWSMHLGSVEAASVEVAEVLSGPDRQHTPESIAKNYRRWRKFYARREVELIDYEASRGWSIPPDCRCARCVRGSDD